MGEDNGLIAVEVVDDLRVNWNIEPGNRHDAVVEHPAYDYVALGRNRADELYVLSQNLVPGIPDFEKDNLVQGFECHLLRIVFEPVCNLLPKCEEPVLQSLIEEELLSVHVLLEGIEGVAEALVQVDEHVEVVLFAPCPAVLQVPESALDGVALFVFEDVVVHRNPDMVKAHGCDIGNILFGDKGIEMVQVILLELGNPASEIDSTPETFKTPHN